MSKRNQSKGGNNVTSIDKGWDSKGSGGSYKPTPKCYESHPPYEIAPGITIYGGSCWHPKEGMDVYGGFDAGMKFQSQQQPWNKKEAGPIEFLLKITDMQPPSDLIEFSKMIGWLMVQLQNGKKVHLGCIGGHGRTGLVLAVLRRQLTGDENATQHVRDNYCKKAVESKSQVEWLQKNFGITPVEPTKQYSYGTTGSSGSLNKGSNDRGGQGSLAMDDLGSPPLDFGRTKDTTRFHADDPSRVKSTSTGLPLFSANSMWG